MCEETSLSEGNPVPADAGMSASWSLGSLSEPPGSLSSGAPAEVDASLKPPGPRKISTRKNRATSFIALEDVAAILQHSWTTPYSGRPSKK